MRPIRRLARSARHAYRIWRSSERRFLKSPPGHYHSALPSDDDVRLALSASDEDQLLGVRLDEEAQLGLLNELAKFAADWPFPAKPTNGFRYHYDNGYCLRSDGLVLYSMMRHLRPARVIEVGSGFSSALMLDTDEASLDRKTEFTFIDPNPARLNQLLRPNDRTRCRVISQPVQQVGLSEFERLESGDLLYVDSSHVSKAGSDINYLFFQVLPRLKPGVVVHVHDIFWPFEYPPEWYAEGIAWNEAYLVRAFLMFSTAYRVVLWLPGLCARRGDQLSAIWPDGRGNRDQPSGLWLLRT